MRLDNIKIGQTTVKVMRKEEGQEGFREIHRGAIVQNLGAFVRVFNYEKDGDHDPICSELFPVKSNNCYVEPVGELKAHQAVKVPVQFNK